MPHQPTVRVLTPEEPLAHRAEGARLLRSRV